MLYLALTSISSFLAISLVKDPYSINLSIVIGVLENFRIVNIGPQRDIGGKTTFTREPSGKRVSHIGFAWFTSLPAKPTIR